MYTLIHSRFVGRTMRQMLAVVPNLLLHVQILHHSFFNIKIDSRVVFYDFILFLLLTGPDLFSIYFSALYYTMSSLTTCGFGNIAPNTSAEKLFGCVTMLLGCKYTLLLIVFLIYSVIL